MNRTVPILSRLRRCDNGAVTIEFVVLTAGVVMLGIGVGEPIRTSLADFLNAINDVLLLHPK